MSSPQTLMKNPAFDSPSRGGQFVPHNIEIDLPPAAIQAQADAAKKIASEKKEYFTEREYHTSGSPQFSHLNEAKLDILTDRVKLLYSKHFQDDVRCGKAQLAFAIAPNVSIENPLGADAGLLTFPEGSFLLDDVDFGSVMYVRSCYVALTKLILETKLKKLVVIGNPGAGKSIFAIYFIWSLFNDHPTSIVFYRRSSRFWRISMDSKSKQMKVQKLQASYGIADHVDEEVKGCNSAEMNAAMSRMYYVHDAMSHEVPGDCPIRILAVSSPDREKYKQFLKVRAKLRLLPCCSKAEMFVMRDFIFCGKVFRNDGKAEVNEKGEFLLEQPFYGVQHNLINKSLPKVSAAQLEERYEKLGGIPRHCFDTQEQVEFYLEELENKRRGIRSETEI